MEIPGRHARPQTDKQTEEKEACGGGWHGRLGMMDGNMRDDAGAEGEGTKMTQNGYTVSTSTYAQLHSVQSQVSAMIPKVFLVIRSIVIDLFVLCCSIRSCSFGLITVCKINRSGV